MPLTSDSLNPQPDDEPPKAAPVTLRVSFTRDKVTPGTSRYEADDENSPVRTIYVRKSHELAAAGRIIVEITTA